jgi:hypothetical protein
VYRMSKSLGQKNFPPWPAAAEPAHKQRHDILITGSVGLSLDVHSCPKWTKFNFSGQAIRSFLPTIT